MPIRVHEDHVDGVVVERIELEDRSGVVWYVRTNPSTSETIEEREANAVEQGLYDEATDDGADRTRAGQLKTFLENNPDPSTWTNAQLRTGLEWLLRFKIRELRRAGLVE